MRAPLRTTFAVLGLAVVAGLLLAAALLWSGAYNVGADDRHAPPTAALLRAVRERSIAARAGDVAPPALDDPALVRQGAGNYDAMCTGCHLRPGMAPTELSRGLYPAPPDLSRAAAGDPARQFWMIKHGIKATGMPAWGRSMEDAYIWGMVAFLQRLPSLDAQAYEALVASSGGHAHGGGETPAGHAAMDGEEASAPAAARAAAASAPAHPHAQGMPPHGHTGTDEVAKPGTDAASTAAAEPATTTNTETEAGEQDGHHEHMHEH